jgi:dihydrofolate synthase/folylpolyglutamate synthase
MARGAEEILQRLELHGIRLGLETTGRLLDRLGRPQERFASVLVAGTNGKGSTATLLASILQAAGYRTGLYTSPHLEQVEERIRVDGRVVAPDRLAAVLDRTVRLAEAIEDAPPTYFEALTVAALELFAAAEVEIAVLEVGMGGRLDATNVVDPVLSLIAELSVDHTEHLGVEATAIAREKGGILRRDRPAVVASPGGPGSPGPDGASGSGEAVAALAALAADLGAPLERLSETVVVRGAAPSGDERRVSLVTPAGAHELSLRLSGDHQLANLALAVRGAELLAKEGWSALNPIAIAAGVVRCRWPGRIERVEPVGLRPVLLDAAHNLSAVERLVSYLTERGEPFDLLFGVLADKPVEEMLPRLAAVAGEIFLTEPPSGRACPVDRLVPLAGPGLREAVADPVAALDEALADRAGPLLVVCGSIYLVGTARARLRQLTGVPAPASDPLW